MNEFVVFYSDTLDIIGQDLTYLEALDVVDRVSGKATLACKEFYVVICTFRRRLRGIV